MDRFIADRMTSGEPDAEDVLIEAWTNTASILRTETLPFATQEQKERLVNCEYDQFWQEHTAIVKDIETNTSGTTRQLLDNAKLHLEDQLASREEHFNKTTLPEAKRRAFAKGVLGLCRFRR